MALVTEISIDITGVNRFEYVVAKQGDGGARYVLVTLLNNGKVYVLDSLTKARALIIKPDKKEILKDCTISNNKIELELTKNILEYAGTASVEIILTNNSTGDVLTSAEFDLKIKATNSTEKIESSTDYESLKEGLLKLDSVATQQELEVERKRINNLTKLGAGSTTGDAELTDIRIAYNGKEYESAGEAVREQCATLKDEIDMANNKIVVASSEQEIKDDGKFYLYNGRVYYYNNGKLVQGTEYTLVVPNNQIAINQYDTVMTIGNAVNEYAFNEADNGTFVWRNL